MQVLRWGPLDGPEVVGHGENIARQNGALFELPLGVGPQLDTAGSSSIVILVQFPDPWHHVISYVWAGVAQTVQIRSDHDLPSFVLSSARSPARRWSTFWNPSPHLPTTFQVGILTLLATRGPPPFVPWCWALRDEGDEHDGRTGQYPGDQDHPIASF